MILYTFFGRKHRNGGTSIQLRFVIKKSIQTQTQNIRRICLSCSFALFQFSLFESRKCYALLLHIVLDECWLNYVAAVKAAQKQSQSKLFADL